MSPADIYINGNLLRLRREAKGLVLNDMATRACMSVKQIRQLEEGGTSSFYSTAVKATAAKKVGALLGLSAEEVFAQDLQQDVAVEAELAEASSSGHIEVPEVVHQTHTSGLSEDLIASTDLDELPLVHENQKSKISIWAMAALVVMVLSAVAYMQPQEEVSQEAAPPLQVIPADESASAASTAAISAVELAIVEASTVKPASSAFLPASSSVAPTVATRPASTTFIALPSVSAASKAP
jgi:transcriptional regulator with XRE-family HTH domain